MIEKDFEPENPVSLENLTDKTCRWPIGHPDEKDFYFCGRTPMDEKFTANFTFCTHINLVVKEAKILKKQQKKFQASYKKK